MAGRYHHRQPSHIFQEAASLATPWDDWDEPVRHYFIGNESALTERHRANVQAVVDMWVADWNVVTNVSLADEHTIAIVVHGALMDDEQDRLSKEIGREAERIEGEFLKEGFEMFHPETGNVVRIPPEK